MTETEFKQLQRGQVCRWTSYWGTDTMLIFKNYEQSPEFAAVFTIAYSAHGHRVGNDFVVYSEENEQLEAIG